MSAKWYAGLCQGDSIARHRRGFSLPQNSEGGTALRSAVQTAYTNAVDITFLIGTAIILVAAAAAVVTLRNLKMHS